MKVTEFSEATKKDHIPAPWENLLSAEDFVSYMPSYRGGAYLEQFVEQHTEHEIIGGITSYFYAPADTQTAHPLLVFLHGATNALAGKICVMHSGCELFASPQYQETMGGAYLLVPLANEKTDENGNLNDSWSPQYLPAIRDLILDIKKKYAVSKVIVTGGSSGGYMSWQVTETYPELIDACIPISSGYIPSVETLHLLDEKGIRMLPAHGRHDELCLFEEAIGEKEALLESLRNCLCYFPEWVRNGDHGVASLNFGFEMGQHCLINQIQANLMFDDGTPYDARLPQGITGWIRDL